ncbi:hypothetical protein TREES_T100021039 [Tupaia chinensis]|uniref:Uncharacterized protein n=1 Tax=Tupaia chinensis TaxID=246437 RepID=L9JAX8_TUPCH|nr:hypothetical protein TREES_T100021039 [Tupaia chinensis]
MLASVLHAHTTQAAMLASVLYARNTWAATLALALYAHLVEGLSLEKPGEEFPFRVAHFPDGRAGLVLADLVEGLSLEKPGEEFPFRVAHFPDGRAGLVLAGFLACLSRHNQKREGMSASWPASHQLLPHGLAVVEGLGLPHGLGGREERAPDTLSAHSGSPGTLLQLPSATAEPATCRRHHLKAMWAGLSSFLVSSRHTLCAFPARASFVVVEDCQGHVAGLGSPSS